MGGSSAYAAKDRLEHRDGTRTLNIEKRSRGDRDEWSSLEMASSPWTAAPSGLRAIHGALRGNLSRRVQALLRC